MWNRWVVDWAPDGKLLGTARLGVDSIDIKNLPGIYILLNGEKPVQVSSKNALGANLRAHALNGSGDWDHFTWMVIPPVESSDELGQQPGSLQADDLPHLYQAALFITLNPPLNTAEDLDRLKLVEYAQSSR